MRSRKGFTLIELLVVVVIIAVLAGIAAANMWQTRERFYVESMRSDLRGLVSMQEIYYGKHFGYGDVAALGGLVTKSKGVDIQVNANSFDGWAATATHDNAPGSQCGVFFGAAYAAAAAPATASGVIECTE